MSIGDGCPESSRNSSCSIMMVVLVVVVGSIVEKWWGRFTSVMVADDWVCLVG